MIKKLNLNWIWSIQSVNQHWHFWGTLFLSGVPDISSRAEASHYTWAPASSAISTIIEKCGEQIKYVCECFYVVVFFPPLLFCFFSHANLMSVKCVWLPALAGLKSSKASKRTNSYETANSLRESSVCLVPFDLLNFIKPKFQLQMWYHV